MSVYLHSKAFVRHCVHTYRRACCEDPMVYFRKANLSNERREKGIGSASVEGSEREKEREREGESSGSKL